MTKSAAVFESEKAGAGWGRVPAQPGVHGPGWNPGYETGNFTYLLVL